MIYPAKSISIDIDRSTEKVYDFLSNPENLPLWAQGLSQSKNKFGVVDHDVILPSGEVNHNPLRVVKNAEGSSEEHVV